MSYLFASVLKKQSSEMTTMRLKVENLQIHYTCHTEMTSFIMKTLLQ